MDRNPGRRFSKQGPRAARIAQREAEAAAEQECETYIRARLQPMLLVNARAATAGFKKQNGR